MFVLIINIGDIYNYALCVLLYIFLITAIMWMYVFFLSTHLFYSLYEDAWFKKNLV